MNWMERKKVCTTNIKMEKTLFSMKKKKSQNMIKNIYIECRNNGEVHDILFFQFHSMIVCFQLFGIHFYCHCACNRFKAKKIVCKLSVGPRLVDWSKNHWHVSSISTIAMSNTISLRLNFSLFTFFLVSLCCLLSQWLIGNF